MGKFRDPLLDHSAAVDGAPVSGAAPAPDPMCLTARQIVRLEALKIAVARNDEDVRAAAAVLAQWIWDGTRTARRAGRPTGPTPIADHAGEAGDD